MRPQLDGQSIGLFFRATRPAFLSVTALAVLLGHASAIHDGYIINYFSAILTLMFALVAHAGANVVNDYYDALNGCDFAESDRIVPFTGGSQTIQKGLLSQKTMGMFGYSLLLSVIPIGLWLATQSGLGLVVIGTLGLLVGWAYSAPPLKLQSRGLGELAITTGWLLVVVGSDYVQRGNFSITPITAGLAYSLLVANILFINQFPDVRADAIAHKGTLAVRLGVQNARWGYLMIILLSYSWIWVATNLRLLPNYSLLAAIPIIPNLLGFYLLMRHAKQPKNLTQAIKITLSCAMAHAMILACVLVFFA